MSKFAKKATTLTASAPGAAYSAAKSAMDEAFEVGKFKESDLPQLTKFFDEMGKQATLRDMEAFAAGAACMQAIMLEERAPQEAFKSVTEAYINAAYKAMGLERSVAQTK